MKLSQAVEYEEMAATYQCLEIARLNEVLKKHGIIDKNTRQEICSEYFFASGKFIDQHWFEANDKRVYPRIHFLELANKEKESEDKMLYISNRLFEFHEYATGNIYWYFDEHDESVKEIVTGFK